MTITKELIEQWAGDAGFWTKDWMTTAVLEVAQRAAAYAVAQRESELLANVDMPEFDGVLYDRGGYELQTVQDLIAAARLQGLQEGTEQGMQFEYTRLTERITELEAECAALKREPLTVEQRERVFVWADQRMEDNHNLSWRNALVEEVEAAHNIRSK